MYSLQHKTFLNNGTLTLDQNNITFSTKCAVNDKKRAGISLALAISKMPHAFTRFCLIRV